MTSVFILLLNGLYSVVYKLKFILYNETSLSPPGRPFPAVGKGPRTSLTPTLPSNPHANGRLFIPEGVIDKEQTTSLFPVNPAIRQDPADNARRHRHSTHVLVWARIGL